MKLNSEQQEAILHKEGPALVLAGPGSGKTTVITGRILALIHLHHIPPSQILVLSFTRAASREIEDRFRRQAPGPAFVRFGTMHAIFYRILRISRPGTASFVLSPALRRQWVEEMLKELFGEEEWAAERVSLVEERLLSGPGKEPRELFPDEAGLERLRRAYTARKMREGCLDYEDILEKSLKLFEEDEEALRLWQAQFRYILIDEYQDTSPLQIALLKKLAGTEANLFAVGDEDQSIYAFRGADSRAMLRFDRDFPGAKLYYLRDCYRSSPQILQAALSLIRHNQMRFPKVLISRGGEGPVPCLFMGRREGEELLFIKQAADLARKHFPGESLAVLCRSRFALRRVAAALAGAGIPFSCEEGAEADHKHWIAEDLFAYLRLGRGSRKREDYLRILNKPLRFLSRQLFAEETAEPDKLLGRLWDKPRLAEKLMELLRDLEQLKDLKPYAAVEYIRRGIGYEEYIRDYAGKRGILSEAFFELLDRLQEESAAFASVRDWEEAREALLKGMAGERREDPGAAGDCIRLLTMHGAKGLEFDRVFLPFLNEEEIPGKRALGKERIEEERRLLYVAMTRARKELWLSCTAAKKGGRSTPSRFLREIRGLSGLGGRH